jgi:hypothetical protein
MSDETRPKKVSSEVDELRGLVAGLTEKVSAMNAPRSGATVRNRVKEHVCSLRELKVDDKILGVVSKLYNVREVKDAFEANKNKALCHVDWVNPKTKEKGTTKDVNYLEFLDQAERVTAKIIVWKRERRFEVDPRKGGGGIGPLYKQSHENETVVDSNYEFEVCYEDQTFTLEITSGEFVGEVTEDAGGGINI